MCFNQCTTCFNAFHCVMLKFRAAVWVFFFSILLQLELVDGWLHMMACSTRLPTGSAYNASVAIKGWRVLDNHLGSERCRPLHCGSQ